ncbi:Outer membrane TonB-dependent transporter, utilization system for glycans and polysaccharides (PUL), SusC family [hydrothermal vent metagenome]|uniref:Outer membrane TonB-dependent transporter, utilization system for glycans and polysaccharides (PUL), SusC family n=1 Tax=hydrothermal vent metagenome TaxID=652676 RepID=A0A3B0SWM8_9ZZZZ
MRTFIFLFCAIAFAFGPKKGFSQDADIIIDTDRTLTVKQVFRLINKQANYKFIYRHDLIKNAPELSLKKGVIKASALLNKCLSPINFTYEFTKDGTVIVKRKPTTSIDNPPKQASNDEEQLQVNGTITDNNGQPLPGASIVEKGATNGTQSDFDGNFSVTIADQNAILVISYLGFTTKEIAVNGNTNLSIILEESTASLEEVVVVAYGTSSRKKLTGAVSSVRADQINETLSTSIDQALQGVAAGVAVSPVNGQPGGGINVKIRGTGSIGAGDDPLYVIDGVPINTGSLDRTTQTYNPLSTINPSDIESISILKDAASASIYGSRAANGVVIITTKRGGSGEAKFTLNTQTGFSDWENFNDYRVLNASEYVELMREGVINAGGNPDDPNSSNYFPLSSVSTDVNWLDEVIRTAITNKVDFSVSGGDEKISLFASLGYLDQQGIAITTDFERISAKFNMDYRASEKISLGAKISLTRNTQHSRFGQTNLTEPLYGGLFMPPTMRIYATPEQIANGEDFGTGYNFDIPNGVSGGNHPIAYANLNFNETRTNRIIGNLYANYKILPNLTFNNSIGIDYIDIRERERFSQLYFDAIGSSTQAELRDFSTNNFDYVITNTLTYNTSIGDHHNFTLLAGNEYQKHIEEFIEARGRGFASDDLDVLDAASEPLAIGGDIIESAIWGVFGRLNYDYKSTLFLDGTIRRDGDSRFGEDTRFGTFWSVGGGYLLSNTKLLRNVEEISSLKIRGSYGTSGNQKFGEYDWRRLYGFEGASYNTNGSAYMGSFPSEIGNPDLGWERNKQFDIALDLGLFNDRIRITAEYYNREVSDMLLNVPISFTSGFNTAPRNLGSMENTGWEFSWNSENIKTEKFKWNTAFNISFNENVVTDLPGDADIIGPLGTTSFRANTIIREGESIYSWYLPRWAGVDPATGVPLWYDSDNNIVTDFGDADRVIVGSPIPDFFGSLSNDFTYKNFSLSAMFYFNYGNEIFRHSARAYVSDGSRFPRNQSAEALARWQRPGDITNVPRYVANNGDGGENASTRFLEDGSFIKLRNVTLAYNIPGRFLEKTKIDDVRIYLQGQNILTWSDYNELDPEVGSNSSARGEYPNPRTFTLGVNVGF